MSATFAYHPKFGWSTKVDPKLRLPGYQSISESALRRALGDLVLQHWSPLKIRRFLEREQARLEPDGRLIVPYVQALRGEG